jgi:hypothetical protein
MISFNVQNTLKDSHLRWILGYRVGVIDGSLCLGSRSGLLLGQHVELVEPGLDVLVG